MRSIVQHQVSSRVAELVEYASVFLARQYLLRQHSFPSREVMAAGTGAGICPAFQNPVLDWNFPDPGVLFHDGRYYAFATNHTGSNVQTAVSNDLVRAATPSLRCSLHLLRCCLYAALAQVASVRSFTIIAACQCDLSDNDSCATITDWRPRGRWPPTDFSWVTNVRRKYNDDRR